MTQGDSGIYVHIANTDWQRLTNLTGTVYTKVTEEDGDLQKINSYICDDFSAIKAMVLTFDCLRQDDAVSFQLLQLNLPPLTLSVLSTRSFMLLSFID